MAGEEIVSGHSFFKRDHEKKYQEKQGLATDSQTDKVVNKIRNNLLKNLNIWEIIIL